MAINFQKIMLAIQELVTKPNSESTYQAFTDVVENGIEYPETEKEEEIPEKRS